MQFIFHTNLLQAKIFLKNLVCSAGIRLQAQPRKSDFFSLPFLFLCLTIFSKKKFCQHGSSQHAVHITSAKEGNLMSRHM